MTTIAVKSWVEIGKSVFDNFDQLVSYLFKKKLISPVEIGFIPDDEIDPKVLQEYKERMESDDFIDVTDM